MISNQNIEVEFLSDFSDSIKANIDWLNYPTKHVCQDFLMIANSKYLLDIQETKVAHTHTISYFNMQ